MGSVARVFHAYERSDGTGQEYAIKALPSVHFAKAEMAQIERYSTRGNPHLPRVFDLLEDGGTRQLEFAGWNGQPVDYRDVHYVVTDWGGEPLARGDAIEPIDQNTACGVVSCLLEALETLESSGIFDYDVRPQNLVARRDRDTGRFIPLTTMLIDVNAVIEGTSGLFVGECREGLGGEYRPPEYFAGKRIELDSRGHVFEAAASLFAMITGHAPFALRPADGQGPRAWRNAHRRGAPLGEIRDPKLRAVIARALAFNPGDRYENVRAFREALGPFDPERIQEGSLLCELGSRNIWRVQPRGLELIGTEDVAKQKGHDLTSVRIVPQGALQHLNR
jgi:serine/threonine protein kinase